MTQQAVSFRWSDRGGSFVQSLTNLRKKEAYCDASIICEDHFHNVHQLVLSTSSDYLAHVFDKAASCQSGGKYPIIALPGISHKCLEAILNYIYTGETTVNVEDLSELRKAASILQISDFAGFIPESTMKFTNKRSMEKDTSYSARKKQRFERSDNFDPVFNKYCEIQNSAASLVANIQDHVSEEPKAVIVKTKILECNSGEGSHFLESDRSITEGEAMSFFEQENEENSPTAFRKT
ncbi:unnamed protein product [Meganyctiphanes norvegica]|uniref:BTB domain-containing protein n=1 Tax=Meganyctiphanes norvegica TaxID=48144 RepID=A0AAV2RI23_MEGNR